MSRFRENVELRFPLIIIRTRRAAALFEALGRSRLAGAFGLGSAIALPVLAGIATFFLLTSLTLILTRPEVQQAQRELGPASYVLLPGINPYLPLLYGWIGIVVALVVHEGAHGVLARRYNYTVKSSGIVLFLGIPIGAFVETDESEIRSGRFSEVVKILSSGPASNAAVAALALIGVLVISSGLVPSIPIVVERVMEGFPAASAGIEPGDRIVSVNGNLVLSLQDLRRAFAAAGVGTAVRVGVERAGKLLEFDLRLADIGNGTPGIGVAIRDADLLAYSSTVLERFRSVATSNPVVLLVPPTLDVFTYPFSERQICVVREKGEDCRTISSLFTHPVLGGSFVAVSALLYWIWFVNINVAIFNALPIYPLDGGQALRKLLTFLVKGAEGQRIASAITTGVTIFFVSVIISIILLPYLSLR
ncbi:MAG: site-2 protease family protein [Nitrososphaerota archaeon]